MNKTVLRVVLHSVLAIASVALIVAGGLEVLTRNSRMMSYQRGFALKSFKEAYPGRTILTPVRGRFFTDCSYATVEVQSSEVLEPKAALIWLENGTWKFVQVEKTAFLFNDDATQAECHQEVGR